MKSTPTRTSLATHSAEPGDTIVTRRSWLVALAVGLPLITGACAEIIPKIELRDDYVFKRFLQPTRVVSEVKRDELGNPILPKSQQQPATN